MLEELPLDRLEVGRLGATDQLQASVEQVCLDGPCVGRRRTARDELAPFERVDDPRDPAEAQPALRGEDRQSQVAILRRSQPPEHLDAAQRQAELGLEFGLERTRDLLVRLEHADPGVLVGVRPGGQAIVTKDVCTGLGGGVVSWCCHYLLWQLYSSSQPLDSAWYVTWVNEVAAVRLV